MHLVSTIHLVHDDVSEPAGDRQEGVHGVGIRVEFVTDEQVIRVVPANGIACRLVVLCDDAFEKLDVVTGLVAVGKICLRSPSLGRGKRVEGVKAAAIRAIEISDLVAIEISHCHGVRLLSRCFRAEVAQPAGPTDPRSTLGPANRVGPLPAILLRK
ncbi:MAG: hypothetical protein NTV52_19175 [Acidobacteria bacterium]|nr:hypothetical protein [Acidobacteriota bacterium]